jgi:hypothetical protein
MKKVRFTQDSGFARAGEEYIYKTEIANQLVLNGVAVLVEDTETGKPKKAKAEKN